MKYIFRIFAIVATIIISSCANLEEEQDPAEFFIPQFTSCEAREAYFPYATSFYLEAFLRRPSKASILEAGFVYGYDPSLSDGQTVKVEIIDPLVISTNSSKPSKKYDETHGFQTTVTPSQFGKPFYFQAYINGVLGQKVTSAITEYNIPPFEKFVILNNPEVKSTSFSEISVSSSLCWLAEGILIIEHGFCYAYDRTPTLDDSYIQVEGDGLNTGRPFEVVIEGLEQGRTVVIVSYAKDDHGNVVYSAPVTVMLGNDLSSSGTANCYIVSYAGEYKFKTVKGNTSTSVGSVSSASVVWETFGTSTKPSVGDLVNTVSYLNGYITFNATGKKGNALIAAKDASGNILWSWHIWCTDKPEDQVYKNGAGTMMDRNLGATSATPGDVGALGLMYQWGRKDPFLGSSSISSGITAVSTITWPSTVSSNSSYGTIAYATSHPTTFITYNENNYDWYYTGSSSTDNTRWNSNKGTYDPCPSGYRVPDDGSNGVWSKALGSPSPFYDGPWNSTSKGMDFKSYFTSNTQCWYPASGFLNDGDGSLINVGSYGLYWVCAPDSDTWPLFFNYGGSVLPSSSSRAYGLAVRCIRE